MNRILRTITDRLLYGGSSHLKNYEQQCIDCLCEKLTKDARAIIRGQLANIRLIQRFSNNRMVVFHLADDKHLTLFPNRSSEVYAASLSLKDSLQTTCTFVFHEGRLSSLEYNRFPRFSDERVICGALDINVDMMLPCENDVKLLDVRFIGSLRLLEDVATLSEVLAPASNIEVSNFLRWLSTPVASDYIEIIQQTNGFLANGWRFTGTKARTVIQEETTLVLLAESVDRAICIDKNISSESLLVLSFEDALLINAETNFITTLIGLL